MYDSASTIMEQKLSQIQGVGQVVVGGASYPSVRVDVNPPQLNRYGLTLAKIQSTAEPAEFRHRARANHQRRR